MEQVLHFDGDDVGSRLELLLLDGKLDEAASLSERITSAMLNFRHSLEGLAGLKIRLFGGDDLIATAPLSSLASADLNALRSKFQSDCGCTISGGTGATVQEALANLRRAKLSGRNQLVGFGVVT